MRAAWLAGGLWRRGVVGVGMAVLEGARDRGVQRQRTAAEGIAAVNGHGAGAAGRFRGWRRGRQAEGHASAHQLPQVPYRVEATAPGDDSQPWNPARARTCSAVSPSLFRASRLAPAATSTLTTSTRPCCAATNSGVACACEADGRRRRRSRAGQTA